MAKRSLGKPRFYADMLQYLKVLGYYDGSDTPELFNFDPTNAQEYELNESTTSTGGFVETYALPFIFRINKPSKSLDRLLTQVPNESGLYAAILGHNINDIDLSVKSNTDVFQADNFFNVFANKPEYDGFSIMNFTNCGDDTDITKIQFILAPLLDQMPKTINLGALSFGRWFEPEFAFDIQASLSTSYEGINTQTTVGGYTISNVKHLGQPNWGNGLPAWTLQKLDEEDYDLGGSKGRRQWEVGFSFLSDDKLFHSASNPDKFFTYNEESQEHTLDTSLSSFFKLTFNGKLPFMFTPDSSAVDKEFALCRITNQPKFKQVANNLFSTSLVITETW